MGTLDASTLESESDRSTPLRVEPLQEVGALVLVWSAKEPHRVGESLMILPGQPRIFGRGGGPVDEGTRIELCQWRPGLLRGTDSIRSAVISRRQLRCVAYPDGTLSVRNVGTRRLLYHGQPADEVQLRPQALIELEGELLFLYVRRPFQLCFEPAPALDFPFGGPDPDGIVGESESAWRLRARIMAVAKRAFTHTLVHGPSGAGKELVSGAIHRLSGLPPRKLIARNATTFADTLIDSELFGLAPHSGVANASPKGRPGLVEMADGGSLVLDEAADMPMGQQPRLLRVLDAGGEFHRTGDTSARHSRFRLIGLTNRPLALIRSDLCARLLQRVEVAGLNERREDIPLLARHLLRNLVRSDQSIAQRFFSGPDLLEPRLSAALVRALVSHRYTTHTRELERLLIEAIDASMEDTVDVPPTVPWPSPEPSAPTLAEGLDDPYAPSRPSGRDVPAPVPSPDDSTQKPPFTPEALRDLEIFRRHRFNVSQVGRDPEFGHRRTTANARFRQLLHRALEAAQGDEQRAAVLMAGRTDRMLIELARKRLHSFGTRSEDVDGEDPED